MPKPPLTATQESRLIRYLDQELLRLSGGFESRHSGPSARLPTLASFLDTILPLLAFVLSIPAAPPSHSLRVAYLLQLTGYLAPACDGYTLDDSTLPHLFDALACFDHGWAAVLEGRDWDSARGAPAPPSPAPPQRDAHQGAPPLRTTDRVRLDSLVRDLQGVLAVSLGLPEFVPLENDPFQQVLRQRDLVAPPRVSEPDERHDGDDEMELASGATTPSLMSDASTAGDPTDDDAMSLDASVATPSEVINPDDALDGDNEDDEDGVDFEEVLPPSSSSSSFPSRTTTTTNSRFPDAYADPPAADGSFSLHFTGVPPPTLQDGELSLAGGQTPFVAQQRGFDPDAEYPLSEEEGDPIVEGDEHEQEDGMSDETKRRLEGVFERTQALLRELRTTAEAEAGA
ncbi:uncharacterized protein RHOBADRAFT_52999 [Rhodotorula graminis WP1]|uniref:Uncharacterized protein n=1 Tax=Rhodotorula graminis (strain WP1) TaxID=578459 RepID=A0A194S5Y5_RHOGW|nr:uncharacterized protein RHOBADRAFT_52999 [Rhodotorula graminis WP1]KPV75997.1 hypothetical protein RHOBADRAFT_52999 [Rhodotorula graminis WP1]